MRSEFLLTNLNELATSGTSSFESREHFSANFVLEFPIFGRWMYAFQGTVQSEIKLCQISVDLKHFSRKKLKNWKEIFKRSNWDILFES